MMKKQVIVIHGGDTFSTYEEFILFLKDFKIDLNRFRGKDWKSTLQDALGVEYDVLCPQMPNKQNAKYSEWKLWFDKIIPLLNDNIILVGHSVGGIFLVKYLAEENISKKINATFLIATPYDMDGNRKIFEFVLPESLELFEKQGGKIFIYQSKDDPIVFRSEAEKYQRALPNATVILFGDRGHFTQEELPELIAEIKRI